MPERSEPRPGASPDAPGFRIPDDPAELRIEQIARVSAELSAATTMDAVVAAAVDHAAVALGAAVSTLMLTEGDRLRLLAGHGLRAGVQESWETFGLDDVNPASDAARTGRPVVLADVETVEREYPVLRTQMPAGRSLVCVPLDSTSPAVGVIGLTFEQGWTPGEAELALLTVFAEACGQAVRRVLASEEAAKRDWELAFLAERIARTVEQPGLRVDAGERREPVRAARSRTGAPSTSSPTASPARWPWRTSTRRRCGGRGSCRSATRPTTTSADRRGQRLPDRTQRVLPRDHRRDARRRRARRGAPAPVARAQPARRRWSSRSRAATSTLGVLTLIRTDDSPPYAHSDLVLAEEVGRRAGVAIENARLYGQTQDVALQLQRAVLPEAVDDIPVLGGGRALRTGWPGRCRRRLLRRRPTAERQPRARDRRRHGPRRAGGRRDGPDPCGDPCLSQPRPRPGDGRRPTSTRCSRGSRSRSWSPCSTPSPILRPAR